MDTLRDRTAVELLSGAGDVLQPSVLRDLRDCVMMLDGQGRVSHASRGSIAALDLQHEKDVIGQVWSDLWPTTDRAPLEEAVARGLRGTITKYWTSFVQTDGSVSQWDIRVSPVRDASSAVTSVIAVARRVTSH